MGRTSHYCVLATAGSVANQPTVAGPVVDTSMTEDSLVTHSLGYVQGSSQAAQSQIALPGAWQAIDKDGCQAFVFDGNLAS